ncbi:unnamed protein product [Strongylus vulgaris]|uniref:Uncharacterized protein n=1 Tax=Strongylus vulgaris TaxID=40348 RepID=A0A3P7JGJ1_STRVU|nr:unnamed protein product [Strongylus vulgaris]
MQHNHSVATSGKGSLLQAIFTPIGEKGAKIGAIVFNMYTVPAFFMVILSVICCFVVQFLFKEEYAGIIKDEDKNDNPYMVIPKFDTIPALICIYLWVVSCMVATNIEV